MTAEPGDFTIENGLLVFTAQYHLRRGYCCGNACRNCPYSLVDVAGEANPADDPRDRP